MTKQSSNKKVRRSAHFIALCTLLFALSVGASAETDALRTL